MDRKLFFDFFRTLLGRSLQADEVDRLDDVLDCAAGDEAACAVFAERRVGPAGIALVKQFEGCAKRRADGLIEAYPDPGTGGAPWTIGWGATGPDIDRGTVWTQQQCDARLEADLGRHAAEVAAAIGGAATSQHQFDALVSFHYNTGAIRTATLTRRHVAGDHEGAAREFARWVHAGGRVMNGLVRRRSAETALYRG